MRVTTKSKGLFARAQTLLPGGVSSPVRAFSSVGTHPIFVERGEGAYIVDVDGNRYVDYVLSWGPLILGHAHPRVVQALAEATARGTSFGAPTELECALADLIMERMSSIEMIRFVSSGTEAVMSALRLARAFTRRSKIVKFQGCYHGHADAMLVQAGSGVATLSLPDSPGVLDHTAADTLVAQYNNLDSVYELFEENRHEIAAVIVEPVAGNMGLVLPQPGFLSGLREVTRGDGALLIFDEVMTGFRVDAGGAQKLYGIEPDLTTLGKVIGGGLPVGAYGGRMDVMQMVAPSGPVYQAGTLSGNPLAMTAGIETLKAINNVELWRGLRDTAQVLCAGLRAAAADAGVAVTAHAVGSMFGMFFSEQPVVDWQSASSANRELFTAYFKRMLDSGIYIAPSQFEAGFVSTAHGSVELDTTIDAAAQAMRALRMGAGHER